MKNSFNIEVCFKDTPTYQYEWESYSIIDGIKVERIPSKLFRTLLTYESKVQYKSNTLLISDTKNAAVLKLAKDGTVIKKSFLSFSKELDVCEFAFSLKESNLKCTISNKKIKYPKKVSFEIEMSNYIINSIKKSDDEYLSKYLYYLYFEEIEGYSKERLLRSVKNAPLEKNMKLYKFLIES